MWLGNYYTEEVWEEFGSEDGGLRMMLMKGRMGYLQNEMQEKLEHCKLITTLSDSSWNRC